MNKKVIFCAGISVRSGTNYIGSIFSEMNSVDTLPKDTSKGEFPFFSDKTLLNYDGWVNGFKSTFFAKPNINATKLAPFFSEGFLNYLQKEYDLNKESLFVKNPSLQNLEKFYDFFPDGKLIVITRSAPDIIASSLKASLLIRKSRSTWYKLKAKIKRYSGYNMYSYSKAYVNHANQLLKLREDLKGQFLEVKYEDIVLNPNEKIKEILTYCEVDYSEMELNNAINAKVVGSSYFGSKKHTQNWGKLEKTKEFNSIGRHKSWNWYNRFVYKLIASKSNKKVGYTDQL